MLSLFFVLLNDNVDSRHGNSSMLGEFAVGSSSSRYKCHNCIVLRWLQISSHSLPLLRRIILFKFKLYSMFHFYKLPMVLFLIEYITLKILLQSIPFSSFFRTVCPAQKWYQWCLPRKNAKVIENPCFNSTWLKRNKPNSYLF